MEEGHAVVVGQPDDHDLAIEPAQLAKERLALVAALVTLGGEKTGLRPDDGKGIDRVENALAARVFAHQFGDDAHMRGGFVDIPGRAFAEIEVKGRHNQRAVFAKNVQQGVNHGLRAAIHAAE